LPGGTELLLYRVPGMIALVAVAAFYFGHLLVARRSPERTFARNLKVSRGFAAAVLVTTGIASIVQWWPLWDRAFLVSHADGAGTLVETWALQVFVGHLVADLLWIAAGKVLSESRAKRDLVIHHLLGLAACAAAWWLEAGYAVIGVVLVSEGLPVLTGIGAWARNRKNRALEHWVLKASLGFILCFRMPLWLFVGGTLAFGLTTGTAPEIHRILAPVALPAILFVMVLDLYWCRTYVRLLQAFDTPESEGIRGVSIDPLAPLFPQEA
jgi:hypothetical protein